ncbi:MAG: 4-(cytidine 5'-diphospho)-2-C-methyl-D-erythritol kinase [Thermoleophilia bacterium]|nr:4-(cytidine 5'-diphospho)-2-C-methyl-D-erythritol kinase [Thermoleophilia bacterium]
MTADPTIVRACAKVNLVLRVGAKRPDGYHELVTLIARVSLADVLLIDTATQTTVTCPGLPGGDTLVTRALELLCEAAGYDEGFTVHIDKRIPHGAGLGGGSADAAAVLRFANDLLPTPLIPSELARIAALIGSDVPALLHDEATLARGRGEHVEVLGELPRAYLVLAHPGQPLATRDVYAAYRPDDRPLPRTVALPTTLDELVNVIENDLAVPAEQLEPACRAIRDELMFAGALAATVSGSGSAVFGIFPTEEEAETASANLVYAKWNVTSTLGIR